MASSRASLRASSTPGSTGADSPLVCATATSPGSPERDGVQQFVASWNELPSKLPAALRAARDRKTPTRSE
jgi:hypothetical protein